METANRIWTKTDIENLLETNTEFVKRSLVKMYNRQTENEKAHKQTRIYNAVGFNKPDGYKLASFAEFYLRRGYLTDKQIYVVRKRLLKYTSQITDIANSSNKK